MIYANEDSSLKAALESAGRGDVSGLIINSGGLLADEIDDLTMQKVYVLLALGYTLDASDDAAERCAGLLDLFPEEFDGNPSAAIIGFLAGKVKAGDLSARTSSAPDDWKAVASVARYIAGVRSKKDLRELYSETQSYKEAIAGLPLDSWALVWNKRLPKWHGYIQAGRGEAEELEPLIAAGRPCVTATAEQDDSAKHAETINSIVSLYLQNEPDKARKSATEAKGATASKDDPFHVILDYLSGTKMDPSVVAEKTAASAVNWALATVAVFARSLSDSEKPDKQTLYFCIDNYEGNIKLLSKNPEVAKWRQSVEHWRKWCDSGFKAEACASGEPLLLARSVKCKAEPKQATFKDITTVALEDFQEGRSERYAGRPRPISLDFDDKVLRSCSSRGSITVSRSRPSCNTGVEIPPIFTSANPKRRSGQLPSLRISIVSGCVSLHAHAI